MPSYKGKFQYQSQDGSVTQQGGCQLQFDDEMLTLTPESGHPLVSDLGDFDSLVAADYSVLLPLYSGETLRLQQFGKSYEDLVRELSDSYRKRTLQCLLLGDMEEVDRFTGFFTLRPASGETASGPAEIRIFQTNIAVLPASSQAFQWRVSDVSNLQFDPQNYEIAMESYFGRLQFNKLAKRTELFHTTLRKALEAVNAETSQALHSILPFLSASQLQSAASLLPEGHSASASKLAAIHPRIPEALAANAVDKTLKPYYDHLLSRTAKGALFAGFKLIRPEDNDLQGAGAEDPTEAGDNASAETMPDADSSAPPALYWFFFPIAASSGSAEAANVVAWEASSAAGRATYFFRLVDESETASLRDAGKAPHVIQTGIERINRVLGMLNFRRRPIYLSDDDLTGNPTFRRYAIAARRMPELRQVRAAFLGRAIHSSFEAWQAQVDAITAAQRSSR